MRTSKMWRRIAGGAAVAAVVVVALPGAKVSAKAKAAGAAMKITDIDVGDFAGIPQNKIISIQFSQVVDPASVSPATLQVRAQNAKGTGYTIQVPGSFQVAGSTVRFLPRLPTHLRDPADPAGGFFPAGSIKDNASLNAGFQPNKNHLITVVGSPSLSPVRSTSGRGLAHNYTARFTTSPDTIKSEAFTIDTYQDNPPPAFQFSNPPDKVAAADDQYALHGGTLDVPSAINVSIFGKKVPLSPNTLRPSGNVVCTLLARADDPSYRKVMGGSPFVEQNFDTVRMAWVPRFPLPDVSTYSLAISNKVLDLTEVYNFDANPGRLRLRAMYEFLVTARLLNPATPAQQLANPPLELIQEDWPTDAATRGTLKANLLALGDKYPDEINPRVMVMFTTRDELVTHSKLTVNFLQSEGYFDASKSTAEWDQTIASAASGVFTAAGGSAVLGDLKPVSNTTVSAIAYPGSVLNYRSIIIPAGVTVTFTGSPQPSQPTTATVLPINMPLPSPPVTIKALTFVLDGTISVDGTAGIDGTQSGTYTANITIPTPAVPGGPGGGYGGYAPAGVVGGTPGQYSSLGASSGTGGVGNDVNLIPASATDGGRGGQGGKAGTGTGYTMASGGGGGGGSRLAGANGTNAAMSASYPTYGSWAGSGGAGGAGATGNSDLANLVGGAGGGGGGNAQAYTQSTYNWGTPGASGGGGGGALLVQTSATLTVGNSGLFRARGGKGGKGVNTSYTGGGGGGGGGGGAVLLRTSRGFLFANAPAAVDVTGGAGGTPVTTTYGTGGTGGNGGAGFVRFEDPNGGISVPGATQGSYLPTGGGLPSYVYSKFIDVGVDQVKFLNPTAADFQITSGNDAILVEIQLAVENPSTLGTPLITAIDANENSTNVKQVSQWMPVRLLDSTSTGGAIKVPGNNLADAVFNIDTKANGFNYRFVRLRITFQLDPTQTAQSPVPFIDQFVLKYDFNF